jgi:hypothetical protein
VVTQDWRVGTIGSADSPDGKAARNGFINGVKFFCGLCRTVVPPFVDYPVYYDLPQNANLEDLRAAVDFMTAQAVKTVFVQQDAAAQDLPGLLAEAGVNVILDKSPPTNVMENWIVSVGVDAENALLGALDSVLAGQVAEGPQVNIIITGSNQNLISPGKINHVSKMLEDLNTGYIDTGVDPVTGEFK